jgi:hypothetical protein
MKRWLPLSTSGAAAAAAAVFFALLSAANGACAGVTGAATAPALGRTVVTLLAHADYAALGAHTCAPGGLAFAPYARNLEVLAPVRLTADEVQQFAQSQSKRVWGRYDGTGAPIELTPMAYHAEFIYDVDYRKRARVSVRTPSQLSADADLSALASAFPQAGLVIYRDPGSPRNAYKDARELIMVVRASGKQWCLQALAHSEDTI